MALCSFNDIGNFLSTSSETGDSAQYRVDLPPDDILVKEAIFRKDGDGFVFSRKGLEKFIARTFGCAELVHSGNVCCFGTVRGQELHYSAAPLPNFYSMHGPETSIIIGSNKADVPPGWKGRAALLSNVFTVKDGRVVLVKSGMKMLFPASGEPRPAKGSKKPNVRKKYYLEYFCDYITTRQQKYGVLSFERPRTSRRPARIKVDPRDFIRPRPKELLACMKKKLSVGDISEQTVRRDIKGFSVFNPKKDKTQVYDKRDELLAAIWKNIDNLEFVLSPNTLKAITDEMARIEAPELGGLAETAATAKTGWEDDADDSGHGSTRTIAVEPGLDIDKDLR